MLDRPTVYCTYSIVVSDGSLGCTTGWVQHRDYSIQQNILYLKGYKLHIYYYKTA